MVKTMIISIQIEEGADRRILSNIVGALSIEIIDAAKNDNASSTKGRIRLYGKHITYQIEME